jgi:RNA polymerase sigma factor (sigma-70 family)
MGESFEKLVMDVRPAVARALFAAYGPQRGEEALAEAMAWAWEHREQLEAMSNPAGYLYRVGQSRSRPRLRDRIAAFPEPTEMGLDRIEPGLGRALANLTERQRVCVALVVGYHWTYDETADLLAISRSSVQSHVERGMERLRSQLGVTNDVGA